MEHRVAQLEQQLDALITRFLPPILERLEKLEAGQKSAPATSARKRKAMTAEMYDAVKYLSKHGRTDKEISTELNIPYTTVRAYLRLSPERVTELRRKQLDTLRDKASEEVSQDTEPEKPAQSREPNPTGIHLGLEMVQDVYENMPEEPVGGVGEPYEVACDQSPGEFGENGWWEWSLDNKQLAEQYKQADGYPFYYPVERNTILTVQYMNENVQKGIVSQEVDWTPNGGVLRWKIASQ